MKEKLITFETAKLAKEKGFFYKTPKYYSTENPHSIHKDLQCRGILGLMHENTLYQEYIERDEESGLLLYQLTPSVVSAPTQSLLQKWLRESKNKIVLIGLSDFGYSWKIRYLKNKSIFSSRDGGFYKSYEKALESGLQEALKLIKNK